MHSLTQGSSHGSELITKPRLVLKGSSCFCFPSVSSGDFCSFGALPYVTPPNLPLVFGSEHLCSGWEVSCPLTLTDMKTDPAQLQPTRCFLLPDLPLQKAEIPHSGYGCAYTILLLLKVESHNYRSLDLPTGLPKPGPGSTNRHLLDIVPLYTRPGFLLTFSPESSFQELWQDCFYGRHLE